MKIVYDVEGCNGCPMQKLFPRNTFVGPKWGGDRLVVAEAPGAEEALQGEPLVGGSGRLFDSLCTKSGITRNSLTLCNTLSCRPPDNVYPTSSDARAYISKPEAEAAVAQCFANHLKPVLESREWRRIDLLGDRALTAVTGLHGIYAWRGQIVSVAGESKQNVVPTIHPAALMRDQSMMPVVVSDLKKSLIQPPENYDLYPSLSVVEGFTATDFSFDIENNRWTGEVYMVGLSARPYHAICVPFKGPYVAQIQRIFRNATSVVGHNCIQHDIPHLQNAGVELNPEALVFDTMLEHHLLCPDLPHDLEFVASCFTSKPRWKHLAKENEELYCCRDTDTTLQIHNQLLPLLKQEHLLDLYQTISVPVAKICYHLRAQGVRIDPSRITEVRTRLRAQSGELEKLLPESLRTRDIPVNKRLPAPPGTIGKSGKPLKFITVPSAKQVVPWRSDKEVGGWLYQVLGLPVQTHIKTGKVTTDKTALDRLGKFAKGDAEKQAIKAIRKLRGIDETLTTFAKEATTGVQTVHTNYNVHGTNSGRLSSSDPNLQNIPKESRCIYVPHNPSWTIVSADYSQIENRLTAFLARDTERLQRFGNIKFSEHKWAASQFFGIPYEEVEKDNDPMAPYNKAKHIVHGANYGMGARKIALMYDMEEKEVKQLLAKWKAAILKTATWQNWTANEAKSKGVLVNHFGRKRWFYTSSYFTESLSFLPQSLGADILLRAMLGLLYDRVGWPLDMVRKVVPVSIALPKEANLLVTVHDSLVFEVAPKAEDSVIKLVKTVMEQPWRELGGFSCPVSFEVGPSWGELKPYA